MPHKINPIHFENSEGNICIANAFIEAITRKLPVSRLQRDLTDSTILRNIGSLFSYCLIAYSSTITALSKISINDKVIKSQLINNPDVLTEPIQTILRKHKYTDAYETLHSLATENNIDNDVIQRFISNLPSHIYNELQHLDIFHYIGNSNNFS
jgi:adenylosuccinate lyase